ncbi:MAG: hypothetical protein ABEL04_13815 [Salinibacter sp.]|uniref:hypothetical protein n=1 Tax=Salinibacter sp. TaxID=2065818 RepID=UPI0035D492E4
MSALIAERRLVLPVLLVLVGLAAGCEPPTPPGEASRQYDELMQVAAAEAKGRTDTSFFWLPNAGSARARTLMLDLGIDYLHYDRRQGVLCVWNGEGLWPARGYVTALPAATPQTDSVGTLCNIEGECIASAVTETWAQFECR